MLRATLLVCVCLAVVSALDFSDFETCRDCVDAGFGWCPIKRMCGGFANQVCGEGERYEVENRKGKKEKAADGAGEEAAEGKKKKKKKKKDKGGKDEKKKKKKKDKKEKKEKKPKEVVKTITADNFASKVEEADGFWVVKFFAGSDASAAEWKETALALKHVAKVGAMDIAQGANAHYADHDGVVGYFGNKAMPVVYTGPLNTGGVVAWVYEHVRKHLDARLAELA